MLTTGKIEAFGCCYPLSARWKLPMTNAVMSQSGVESGDKTN
jgi:hypothetical protein